jgi:hypothetical protein
MQPGLYNDSVEKERRERGREREKEGKREVFYFDSEGQNKYNNN